MLRILSKSLSRQLERFSEIGSCSRCHECLKQKPLLDNVCLKEEISHKEEKVSRTEEKVCQKEDKVIQKEDKVVQKEEKVVQKEEKCIQKEEKCIQKEEKCTQKEDKCIQKEDICIQKEDICMQKEEKTFPKICPLKLEEKIGPRIEPCPAQIQRVREYLKNKSCITKIVAKTYDKPPTEDVKCPVQISRVKQSLAKRNQLKTIIKECKAKPKELKTVQKLAEVCEIEKKNDCKNRIKQEIEQVKKNEINDVSLLKNQIKKEIENILKSEKVVKDLKEVKDVKKVKDVKDVIPKKEPIGIKDAKDVKEMKEIKNIEVKETKNIEITRNIKEIKLNNEVKDLEKVKDVKEVKNQLLKDIEVKHVENIEVKSTNKSPKSVELEPNDFKRETPLKVSVNVIEVKNIEVKKPEINVEVKDVKKVEDVKDKEVKIPVVIAEVKDVKYEKEVKSPEVIAEVKDVKHEKEVKSPVVNIVDVKDDKDVKDVKEVKSPTVNIEDVKQVKSPVVDILKVKDVDVKEVKDVKEFKPVRRQESNCSVYKIEHNPGFKVEEKVCDIHKISDKTELGDVCMCEKAKKETKGNFFQAAPFKFDSVFKDDKKFNNCFNDKKPNMSKLDTKCPKKKFRSNKSLESIELMTKKAASSVETLEKLVKGQTDKLADRLYLLGCKLEKDIKGMLDSWEKANNKNCLLCNDEITQKPKISKSHPRTTNEKDHQKNIQQASNEVNNAPKNKIPGTPIENFLKSQKDKIAKHHYKNKSITQDEWNHKILPKMPLTQETENVYPDSFEKWEKMGNSYKVEWLKKRENKSKTLPKMGKNCDSIILKPSVAKAKEDIRPKPLEFPEDEVKKYGKTCKNLFSDQKVEIGVENKILADIEIKKLPDIESKKWPDVEIPNKYHVLRSHKNGQNWDNDGFSRSGKEAEEEQNKILKVLQGEEKTVEKESKTKLPDVKVPSKSPEKTKKPEIIRQLVILSKPEKAKNEKNTNSVDKLLDLWEKEEMKNKKNLSRKFWNGLDETFKKIDKKDENAKNPDTIKSEKKRKEIEKFIAEQLWEKTDKKKYIETNFWENTPESKKKPLKILNDQNMSKSNDRKMQKPEIPIELKKFHDLEREIKQKRTNHDLKQVNIYKKSHDLDSKHVAKSHRNDSKHVAKSHDNDSKHVTKSHDNDSKHVEELHDNNSKRVEKSHNDSKHVAKSHDHDSKYVDANENLHRLDLTYADIHGKSNDHDFKRVDKHEKLSDHHSKYVDIRSKSHDSKYVDIRSKPYDHDFKHVEILEHDLKGQNVGKLLEKRHEVIVEKMIKNSGDGGIKNGQIVEKRVEITVEKTVFKNDDGDKVKKNNKPKSKTITKQYVLVKNGTKKKLMKPLSTFKKACKTCPQDLETARLLELLERVKKVNRTAKKNSLKNKNLISKKRRSFSTSAHFQGLNPEDKKFL